MPRTGQFGLISSRLASVMPGLPCPRERAGLSFHHLQTLVPLCRCYDSTRHSKQRTTHWGKLPYAYLPHVLTVTSPSESVAGTFEMPAAAKVDQVDLGRITAGAELAHAGVE